MSDKKAFDFSRGNMYMVDPDEVCIVGGADLPPGERGPLDTEDPGPTHPLFDERLGDPVDESDVANVDTFGVLEPILIVKREEPEGHPVACVNDGRFRVRWARLVNRARKKAGLAPIKIGAVNQRGDDTRQQGVMISTNQVRKNDDPTVMLAKLKRYMERGVTIEDCAPVFKRSVSTLKQLLAYDDTAIDAVKKAVDNGKIEQTTAAEIARVKDPEKQKAALAEVLASAPVGKKASKRSAKVAAKKAKKGADANVGIADKKTQRKILVHVEKKNHVGKSDSTINFWEGFENALRMVLGDGDLDAKVVAVLKEIG